MNIANSLFPWDLLLKWYEINGRHHLPWREYSSGYDASILVYRVWLSEILLQQTQASRVIDFYTRMIEQFPTISELANSDYETFFPYYQ
jgi:A/G-specific adenine glycosylase